MIVRRNAKALEALGAARRGPEACGREFSEKATTSTRYRQRKVPRARRVGVRACLGESPRAPAEGVVLRARALCRNAPKLGAPAARADGTTRQIRWR